MCYQKLPWLLEKLPLEKMYVFVSVSSVCIFILSCCIELEKLYFATQTHTA